MPRSSAIQPERTARIRTDQGRRAIENGARSRWRGRPGIAREHQSLGELGGRPGIDHEQSDSLRLSPAATHVGQSRRWPVGRFVRATAEPRLANLGAQVETQLPQRPVVHIHDFVHAARQEFPDQRRRHARVMADRRQLGDRELRAHEERETGCDNGGLASRGEGGRRPARTCARARVQSARRAATGTTAGASARA